MVRNEPEGIRRYINIGTGNYNPKLAKLYTDLRILIGRYLEHSRIFYFQNGDREEIFIGSADWMSRNLNRRVETDTPIREKDLIAQLKTRLEVTLADNRHTWELQPDGTYIQRRPHVNEPERSCQHAFMDGTSVVDKLWSFWLIERFFDRGLY